MAGALASCSSEEPIAPDGQQQTRAISRASDDIPVSTFSDFKDYVETSEGGEVILAVENFEIDETVEVNAPITIKCAEGVTLTSTASIICNESATFENVTIEANMLGGGIVNLNADGKDYVFESVNFTQKATGKSDTKAGAPTAILVDGLHESSLTVNNSTLTITGSYARGISTWADDAADFRLTMNNTDIIIGTDMTFSMPTTYARGINVGNVSSKYPMVLTNCKIRGAYYPINVNGTLGNPDITTTGCLLEGRGGFNVWTPGTKMTIDGNTEIIGHNPYTGQYENFANIKINNDANNCSVKIGTATLVLDKNPNNTQCFQYPIMFGGMNTTVDFVAETIIYDKVGTLPSIFAQTQQNASIEYSGLDFIHLYLGVEPESTTAAGKATLNSSINDINIISGGVKVSNSVNNSQN